VGGHFGVAQIGESDLNADLGASAALDELLILLGDDLGLEGQLLLGVLFRRSNLSVPGVRSAPAGTVDAALLPATVVDRRVAVEVAEVGVTAG